MITIYKRSLCEQVHVYFVNYTRHKTRSVKTVTKLNVGSLKRRRRKRRRNKCRENVMSDEQNVGQGKRRGENVGSENFG